MADAPVPLHHEHHITNDENDSHIDAYDLTVQINFDIIALLRTVKKPLQEQNVVESKIVSRSLVFAPQRITCWVPVNCQSSSRLVLSTTCRRAKSILRKADL